MAYSNSKAVFFILKVTVLEWNLIQYNGNISGSS